jgi:hypothetical protein
MAKRSNPAKFDRCVKAVKKRGGDTNAYAVCTAAGTRKKKGNPGPQVVKTAYGGYVVRWREDGKVRESQDIFLTREEAESEAYLRERLLQSKAKRKNPADSSASAFKEFHGYEPKELVTVEKKVHHHKHLSAAGQLVGLKVNPVGKGLPVRTIEGLGKKCLLAFNERKNQLFIEGGNQSMSWDELKRFGIRTQHELQTIGKLIAVGYFTDKTHLGKEGGEAIYSHTFRTTNENGVHVTVKIAQYPDLIYRVLDEQFEISGGDYIIRREGIDK